MEKIPQPTESVNSVHILGDQTAGIDLSAHPLRSAHTLSLSLSFCSLWGDRLLLTHHIRSHLCLSRYDTVG